MQNILNTLAFPPQTETGRSQLALFGHVSRIPQEMLAMILAAPSRDILPGGTKTDTGPFAFGFLVATYVVCFYSN